MNHTKYKPYPIVKNIQREWPSHQITYAPIYCSVDLRDGNQALQNPLTIEQKIEYLYSLKKNLPTYRFMYLLSEKNLWEQNAKIVEIIFDTGREAVLWLVWCRFSSEKAKLPLFIIFSQKKLFKNSPDNSSWLNLF